MKSVVVLALAMFGPSAGAGGNKLFVDNDKVHHGESNVLGVGHRRDASRTVEPKAQPLKLRGAHRRKVYGALHLAVTAVSVLFLLAFNPLVVLHQRLLPQLFGIGLFRIRQRARRRSVPTGQAFKEATQALHAESVQRVRLRGTSPPWPSLVLLSGK
jgi:hypothetical protein